MARWKLMTAHYIKVPDVFWEYNETDKFTGRAVRKRFPVPLLLDPRDSSDWTNRWGPKGNEDGEIIVCHEGKGEKSDMVFIGDPSPDMMPMDDEAGAISAKFTEHWSYRPEDMSNQTFSQSIIDKLETKMSEIQSAPQQVSIAGLEDLVSMFGKIMQQNAEMLAFQQKQGARAI